MTNLGYIAGGSENAVKNEKPQKTSREADNWFEKILAQKLNLLIALGIVLRIFMLFFYYYQNRTSPSFHWGDIKINWDSEVYYPFMTKYILQFFRMLSFGNIEIFAFWAFLWDLGITFMFYFVLKSFKINKTKRGLAYLFVNPFFFLNNSFSLTNCGYHFTDSIFFFFYFLALIYLPKQKKFERYLFYFFLALSIGAKYYPFPAIGILFLKYWYEKKWNEMKIGIVSVLPTLILILIVPYFISEEYAKELTNWYNTGAGDISVFIRIIPSAIIFVIWFIFRFKKADVLEILSISIIIMGAFLIFSYHFLRWFQPALFYGILKEKDNIFTFTIKIGHFKRKIIVDNHLLTFYLSFFAVFASYLMIIFVLS